MIHSDDAYSGPGNEKLPWAQSGIADPPIRPHGFCTDDYASNPRECVFTEVTGERCCLPPEAHTLPGSRGASGPVEPDSVNAKRFVPPGFRLDQD